MHRLTPWAAAAAVLAMGTSPAALAQAEAACTPPGLEIFSDPEGDWDNALTSGAGTPEQDILSLSVAETADSLIHFTIKVQSMPPALPPSSAWYSSFETPEGAVRGVRLDVDSLGAISYYSYVAGESNAGTKDGRFVEAGSAVPAVAGSYAADGTITITVTPAQIGMEPGQVLGPFNAATMQGAGTPVTGNLLAATVDEAPAGLGRDGFFDVGACADDTGAKFLGMTAGGLPAGTLVLLSLVALAGRRRRAGC